MTAVPKLLFDQAHQVELELLSEHHFDFFFRVYGDESLMTHVNKPLDKTTATVHFQQNITSSRQPSPRKLTYLIRTATAPDYLGLIGLTWRPVSRREQAFVGVVILPEWRRQGIAHQAKQLIIKSAFAQMGVTTVVAHCDVNNLAANQANRKLGFKQGEIVHNSRKNMAVQVWSVAKK